MNNTQAAESMNPNDPTRRRKSGWTRGLVVIGLGIFFLLQNFGMSVPKNWWTIFIWMAAFGSFFQAWRRFQTEKKLTRSVSGLIVGGLSTSLVATVLAFEFDWGKIWPLFLILGGISTILYGRRPAHE